MWRLTRSDSVNILDDPKVKRSLPRYIDVVRNKKLSKFKISKLIAIKTNLNESTDKLWEQHTKNLEEYHAFEKKFDQNQKYTNEMSSPNFLDLKIELAKRVMKNCHFCERRCNVDRLNDERGFCQCGVEFAISSCFPHLGEEPELVPSGTIFTCGCSIRCLHCQNWSISQWKEKGVLTKPKKVAKIIESLRIQGCRNINMVGGDPTPNCWLWLETMGQVEKSIPTVWNSNSYYSSVTAKLLAGFIDLYLLDFKYGNNDCASLISNAPHYWETCTSNHLMAIKYGELIIRVLVLPGHNECCTKPILEWIAAHLGPWTRINIMFQYRPEWKAHQRKELNRRLTRYEIAEALKIAKNVGLKNLVRS
jgi:putative pyruvate formate lyase activating enzyme